MSQRDHEPIVPGLSMDAAGKVSVSPGFGERLIELALQLESAVTDPVDVEHVVAAMVLASRAGELDPHRPVTEVDDLAEVLQKYLVILFSQHRDRLADD